jgi:hypothetical protein
MCRAWVTRLGARCCCGLGVAQHEAHMLLRIHAVCDDSHPACWERICRIHMWVHRAVADGPAAVLLTVKGMLVPAKAMSRVQLPPTYASCPEVVSSVSWNGEPPRTTTWSRPTICLPAMILSSVVLPAPLAPISKQRLPAGSCRFMSVIRGGCPGMGRPSATQQRDTQQSRTRAAHGDWYICSNRAAIWGRPHLYKRLGSWAQLLE